MAIEASPVALLEVPNATLFAPFNEVYRRRFPEAPPARTTVVVNFGHPDVRVEIEVVALV